MTRLRQQRRRLASNPAVAVLLSFKPLNFILRLWASRKELPRIKRWLYFWGLPLVALEVALFIATGLLAQTPPNGWHSALNVAITVASPFSVGTGVAVALAAVSVFLVPAVIGASVALVVDDQLSRMRRPTEEILADVQGLKERLRELEQKETVVKERGDI